MFDKKSDIDRHVETCLKKINSEQERNLRSLAFAKLYLNVGETELARRYASAYLSAKPDSSEAHRLLGNILEKHGRKEQALEEYRLSLDLDPKQSGLILKVCELLSQDDVILDANRARYWCEQGQLLDPQNPSIFNLKERLISNENGKNSEDLQKLFISELSHRPTDISLRVKLLNHLLANNRINEAYQHVKEIEDKNLGIFSYHFSWYETVTKVLIRYKNENLNSLDTNFWVFFISSLEKLAFLTLDENQSTKSLAESVQNVFNFDQMFQIAQKTLMESSKKMEKQYISEFLAHYKAQLCFLLATLSFKQAKKDQISYKEAITLSTPMLLFAYHTPPADVQSIWLDHSSDKIKNDIPKWHLEASYRCSQAGHVLLSLVKGKKSSFLDRVGQLITGNWKEKVYKNLFITRYHQIKVKNSYFVATFTEEIVLKFPERGDLLRYDEVAQKVFPESLHNLIWIGLNSPFHKFKLSIFDGLQYSNKNLQNCAAETLSILDIEAFLYCCIAQTQVQIEDSKHVIYYNQEKPPILPALITESYGSVTQNKWYTSVYKMFKNSGASSEVSEIRLILIKGLEIVRCAGPHGLDVKLLLQLASTFAQKAKIVTKASEIEVLETQAELYYKCALPLLEKLKNNQIITYPQKRWFDFKGKEIAPTEISMSLEESKLFIAKQLIKKGAHEKSLGMLENLRSPYASFYQAQVYKTLADDQISHNKENVTSEMRSQHIILLSKARDCLYLTLDRLREPSVDRKHPLNAQLGTEIEKIERLLSRIDPDVIQDNVSDENSSSVGSIGEHHNLTLTTSHYHSFNNGNITPRHESTQINQFIDVSRRVEARPSPERLDAQLRQMAAAKDAAISHILQQNKMMVESHRTLVEELRGFKDAVTGLTSSVDELKGIRKSVQDLKIAVDDLQSLKETVEQVHEIKKDLAELRKDTTKLKSSQFNEEDLYNLDEDYNVDYNLANNPAFYPNFPAQRAASLQGAAALPYAAAPGLYGAPGLYSMYPYGLGMGQPGTLPFPESQLPDFRNMGSIGQGLSHLGLNHQLPGTSALPQFLQTPQVKPGVQNLIPTPTAPQNIISVPNLTAQNLATQNIAAQIPQVPISTQNVVGNLPVNVVITASDPLPSSSTATQPVLSVTIPPQHLKGNQVAKKPHNYQIQLPTSSQMSFTQVGAIQNSPLPVSTLSLLNNVGPPVFSSLTVQKSPNQKGSTQLEISLNTSQKSDRSNHDKSASESSILEEHDPCPDFKPIIPLPDEVNVTTGEENEDILFAERAKLYRFVEKEWKERGVGNIKILHNKETGRVRLLMRREQVHKICANHYLMKDMVLTPKPGSNVAFLWAANDFADENIILEKFCVRFKTADIAVQFQKAFEDAKNLIKDTPEEAPKKIESTVEAPKSDTPKDSFGGFKFTSTPTFKPKTQVDNVEKTIAQVSQNKPSPFANFTFETKTAEKVPEFKPVTNFGFEAAKREEKTDFRPVATAETAKNVAVVTLNDSQDQDDFVPTAEFKPVVPLPDLVEVKTGEENSETLYEVKAKLLRFDSETKEWKERGVGQMKILKEKTIRLVMRREQIHKVCCNHQLLKSMVFTNMPKNNKVLNWCAQDYSENVLKTEMFAIRFRSPEICEEFLARIHKAQAMLDSGNYVISNHVTNVSHSSKLESDVQSPQRFKPSSPQPQNVPDKPKKLLSWQCKTCFNHNDGKKNYCEACDTPKNDSLCSKDISSDHDISGDQFSFGVSTSFNTSGGPQGWENVLNQQNAQNWNCDACYTHNSNDITNCLACGGPKPGAEPPKPSSQTGFGNKFKPKAGSWDCKQCYVNNKGTDNVCVACNSSKEGALLLQKPIVDAPKVQSSWGDKFKPQKGSWDCKMCYINNKTDALYCVACESPKDDTVPKKSQGPQGVDLTTSTKYLFGAQPAADTIFGAKNTTTAGFSFGNTPQNQETKTGFSFGTTEKTGFTFGAKPDTQAPIDFTKTGFSFGTPKNDNVPAFGTPTFGAEVSKTNFVTPKTTESSLVFTTPKTTESTFMTPKESFNTPTSTIFGTSNFSFGTPKEPVLDLGAKSTFNFSMPVVTSTKVETTENQDEFIFGSPGKHDFVFKPRSPRKHSENQESEASDIEEERDDIYFKPVIPLPDKVEVKTGEENEEVLYCHRAKLFRFTDGEWKERGIGDVKILRHNETGKLRVVMRREQILKICLNHALTKNIEYKVKDDKTWLFSVPDYSDGEISVRQFCLRFKNPEIVKEFKEAVDNALTGHNVLKTTSAEKTSEPTQKSSDSLDNDVIFISETKVTPEEQAKALKLKLPKNFYAYLQKPPCPGCIGCNPDEYVFSWPKSPKNAEKTNKNETTTENKNLANPFGGSKTPVTLSFTSQVASSPQTTNKLPLVPPKLNPSGGSIFGEPKNIFSGSNMFGATTQTTSQDTKTTFSFTKSENSLLGSKTPVFGETKASIFGSGDQVTPTVEPKASIFGGSDQKTSIFEGNATQTPVFGSEAKTSVFGSTETPKPSLFGSTELKTSIFGSNEAQTPISKASETPVFSAKTQATPVFSAELKTSIFGSETPKNIFGGQSTFFGAKTDASASPIFGTKTNEQTTTPTIFGTKDEKTATVFGANTEDKGIFGGGSGPTFESLAQQNVSFAALANANSTFVGKKDETKSFMFEGAGAPVFGTPKVEKTSNVSKNADQSNADDSQDNVNDDNYDPHYEPIIPLPDAIVVRTGEEDEVVLFIERCKLFRFTQNEGAASEWKERGVGQIKLLHHSINGTYRLLMRREQVHKIVLNQLITTDLDLKPLQSSDQAWMWCGVNYTDDGSNVEKLAVRFKNSEIANKFKQIIEETVEKIKAQKMLTPTVILGEETNSQEEAEHSDEGGEHDDDGEEPYEEGEEHYDEEDYESDESDEGRSTMFSKRCTLSMQQGTEWKTLGMGELKIVYDSELYGSRIVMYDDNKIEISNSAIAINTNLEVQDTTCTWTATEWAVDPPEKRTLKARFSSAAAATEMYYNYEESLQYAHQCEIMDIPLDSTN